MMDLALDDSLAFIPTRASTLKKKRPKDFKAVAFESHKPKIRPSNLGLIQINKNKNLVENEFSIKQAKNEVIKFGTSGFDPQRKEETKVQLAIKLGAKPPKNKYKNYKLLQTERRKDKEEAAKRLNFLQLGKNVRGKSNAKGKSFDRKRRKSKGDILGVYGKVKTVDSK